MKPTTTQLLSYRRVGSQEKTLQPGRFDLWLLNVKKETFELGGLNLWKLRVVSSKIARSTAVTYSSVWRASHELHPLVAQALVGPLNHLGRLPLLPLAQD